MAHKSKRQRLVWNLLRVTLTIACVAWVLGNVTWQDRLVLPDGSVVWGWERTTDAARVLVTDTGQEYPAPPDPDDPLAPNPFTPGFVTLMRSIHLPLLLVAFLAYPLSILASAFRWRMLLRTHQLDPGPLEAIRLTWIGMLANNFMPGATGGDFIKGVSIYRRAPEKWLPAVTTVLIDRVIGLVALMMVAAVAILSQLSDPNMRGTPAKVVLGVLFGIILGAIVFFSGRIRRLLRVAEIVDRLPYKHRIKQLDESVYHYRSHVGVLFRCVGVSLAIHCWNIVCTYLLGLALGIVAVPILYYFMFVPVILTAGAFFPAIAGLGVYEGLFQQFFSRVGATPSSAVALCVLYRIMLLAGSLPGAWPFFQEFSEVRKLASEGELPAELGEIDSSGSDSSLSLSSPA